MKILLGFVSVLIMVLGAVCIFVWSGIYNIAATEPHWPVTEWFLAKVRDRSIEVRSKRLVLPPSNDPSRTEAGLEHYRAMCNFCHGAPGGSRSEFARGLYPNPPALILKELQEYSDRELFWIVQNGIKMTGMPAFGRTHDAAQVAAIVSFLRLLPNLTPEQYGARIEALSVDREKPDGHHHGANGDHEHDVQTHEPEMHHH